MTTSHRAEESGVSAPTAHSPSDRSAPGDTLIAEPKTPRIVGRPFQKGQSGNTAGRPRKGQTIAERVAKADAKIASEAISARNKRLRLTNAVGERAWTTYLAYNLGLPAQKFIVERGDDPGLAWLQQLAAPYVDGESRLLPAADDDVLT